MTYMFMKYTQSCLLVIGASLVLQVLIRQLKLPSTYKPHKTSASAYSNPFKRIFIVKYSHRFRLHGENFVIIVIKLLFNLMQCRT